MSAVDLWKCDVCSKETRDRRNWVRVEGTVLRFGSYPATDRGASLGHDVCSMWCAAGALFGRNYEWQQEHDRLRAGGVYGKDAHK